MSNMPHSDKEQMEPSQIWSTTFTVKCGWWAGWKILKLLKKNNTLSAFRTGFNEGSSYSSFIHSISKPSAAVKSCISFSEKNRIWKPLIS